MAFGSSFLLWARGTRGMMMAASCYKKWPMPVGNDLDGIA